MLINIDETKICTMNHCYSKIDLSDANVEDKGMGTDVFYGDHVDPSSTTEH